MKNKKNILYLLIVLLLIVQVYSIHRINSLENHISNIESSCINYQNTLSNVTSNISSNVRSILEQQASIISSCSYEIGEPDIETLNVPVTFHVQPNALSDSTTVSLKFGDDIAAMERKGTEFVLTETFGIADEIFPTVIVEDKGVSQFEENNNLRIYGGLKSQIFPEMDPHFSGSWGSYSNPYNFKLDGSLYLDNYSESAVNADNTTVFTKAKYVISLDGEELKSADIDLSSPDLAFGIDLDIKCNMEAGQTLSIYVYVEDSLGFTHEYPVFSHVAGEGPGEDFDYNGEKITAPDGTVIFNNAYSY